MAGTVSPVVTSTNISKEETMADIDYAAMDDAASQAAEELMKLGMEADVAQIADWWRRWYLTAGHKRLARILMAVK